MRSHPPKVGHLVLSAFLVVFGFTLIVAGLFRLSAGGIWMVAVAAGVGFAAGGLVSLLKRPRTAGFDLFMASSGLTEQEAEAAWAGLNDDLAESPSQADIRAATRALLLSIEEELRREEATRKARRRPCRRAHLRRRSASSFRSTRRPDRTMLRQGLGS